MNEQGVLDVKYAYILILNSTITHDPPPQWERFDVYSSAARIGWIIAGTVVLFTFGVAIMALFHWTCKSSKSSAEGTAANQETTSTNSGWCSCCSWLTSYQRYQAFQSTSTHDLDEFHLDDDEVTIELHNM